MDDCRERLRRAERDHRLAIGHVRLLKFHARGKLGRQARWRVVQIDRDDLVALVDELVDEKTSDVAGCPGHENRHALASLPDRVCSAIIRVAGRLATGPQASATPVEREGATLGLVALRGSVTTKRVPPSSGNSTWIEPPCCSTIWRQMYSPSPIPDARSPDRA